MIKGLKFTHKSIRLKGGEGSGHRGHAGRPGSVGGSAPGGSTGVSSSSTGNETYTKMSVPIGDAGIEGSTNAYGWFNKHEIATAGAKWSKEADIERQNLKAQVARDLSKATGVPEEEVADFVHRWAESSNDNDMRSLAIQQDAAKEFGIPISAFTQEKINIMNVQKRNLAIKDPTTGKVTYPEKLTPLMDSSTQRTLLRAMYNRTQAELKSRGVTEVRTFRGVGSAEPVKIKVGKSVSFDTNTLSSWSLSEKTAQQFSKGRTKNGIVISSIIPVNRILSLPMSGFGCLREDELVILGGANDIGVRR